MRSFSRLLHRAWWLAPLCACSFLLWVNYIRLQRVEYVSTLAGRAESKDVWDEKSATGYAHGQRELIVPERNEDSFHWIEQTQEMAATGQWRLRSVSNDNAPYGRTLNAASPYRWWLGALAWIDHRFSSRPIGISVERIALVADPLLQVGLLFFFTLFVARQFGSFSATLFSLCFATLFPFAAEYLPGQPDDRGLIHALALASILFLIAGVRKLYSPDLTESKSSRSILPAQRWFAAAGIAGGIGVWVSLPKEIPILAGIIIGGVWMSYIARRTLAKNSALLLPAFPWRTWAFSGGTTVLLVYLVEYLPNHLGGWNLEAVHPLYGVAWFGAGELLTRVIAWIEGRKPSFKLIDIILCVLAFSALLPIPIIMKVSGSRGFLGVDLLATRLTKLPGSPVAENVWAWILHDGMNSAVWAIWLSALSLVVALWIFFRPRTSLVTRLSLCVAFGAALPASVYTFQHLAWWNILDAVFLAITVVGLAEIPSAAFRLRGWSWGLGLGLFIIPGLVRIWPREESRVGRTLTSSEAQLLIERDLSHWLAKRSGATASTVYAPPHGTASLAFYGGLRGVGTFSPDNRVGLGATIAIASVTTMEEAQILFEKRGITYLVIPSWDHFFEEYGHIYLAKNFSGWHPFFVPQLRRWHLPPWLRPVPYQMLAIGGFEDQSVLVFEVVDEQNPAVAASRLAEYMVEIGDVERATEAGEVLRRFPGDIGALAARGQVEMARDNEAGLSQVVDTILPRLSSGADRYLPWDRRVSLAIVLARAKHIDLAQEQVRRCLAEMDDKKARALSTGSLYNLLEMAHAFGLSIGDDKLQKTVLELLSPDLRSRI